MDILQGTVATVIYTNETKTYSVFLLKDYRDERTTCIVYGPPPKTGDDVEVQGDFVVHRKYGKQFKVRAVDRLKPSDLAGAVRYLEQLHVYGLGPKNIEKILLYFGEDLLALLRQPDPAEIMNVPGMREKLKQELYRALRGEGVLEELNRFFEENGIGSKWSRDVYELYGASSVDMVSDNPYRLTEVADMPFKTADIIAANLMFPPDDERRIGAAMRVVLNGLAESGSTCLPTDVLIGRVYQLTGGYADEISSMLQDEIASGYLAAAEHDGMLYVYPAALHHAEFRAAELTKEFVERTDSLLTSPAHFYEGLQRELGLIPGEEQQAAIRMAAEQRSSIITGGPGTGKTTVIKALIEMYRQSGLMRIVLCAPTGRAAKRLTEVAGCEATTIHRLLVPVEGEPYVFLKNEDDPLEADVVIVDEASMLNVQLFYALMTSVPPEARVVIVGDADQLPPIGPGFVLRDLLDAGVVPATGLQRIYRQAEGNTIVSNAREVNEGRMPNLDGTGDFVFMPVESEEEMTETVANMYAALSHQVSDVLELQVISPMRRGDIGSMRLSGAIQAKVNPPGPMKAEIRHREIVYRTGDKIIQVRNDYDLEVFNGEVGVIYAVSSSALSIRFADREVRLPFDELDSIMPAYAITVHKSQGSEYEAVIIPFVGGYGNMLQRNLLYTAITRARRKVLLVGSRRAVEQAVSMTDTEERYTLFKERLQGVGTLSVVRDIIRT